MKIVSGDNFIPADRKLSSTSEIVSVNGDELLPLVSICCPTYNQEHILPDAIESFLMQKTNFNFEILIHDDASSDNTVSVIKEYKAKYPALINTIIQTENQHSKGIKLLTTILFPRARGKYIAICDGDDFWTDPNKLQRQVDFLESHEDYGLVYSKVRIYDTKKSKLEDKTLGSSTTDFDTLLINNGIPTSTVLFRRSLILDYKRVIDPKPEWKLGDKPIWLFISSQSKIMFFNEVTTTYRKNCESVSKSMDAGKNLEFIRSSLEISLFYLEKFNGKKQLVSKVYNSFYKRSFYYYILQNDRNQLKIIYHHLLKTRRFYIIPMIELQSFFPRHRLVTKVLNFATNRLWN